ncbi:MAG: hypothetical protein AAGN64_11365, partial [Bacteroidota bacterium]
MANNVVIMLTLEGGRQVRTELALTDEQLAELGTTATETGVALDKATSDTGLPQLSQQAQQAATSTTALGNAAEATGEQEARLSLEINQLNKRLARLRVLFNEATTDESRARVTRLTAAYTAQRQAIEEQEVVLRRQRTSFGATNDLLIDSSRIFQDFSSQVGIGLGQAVAAASNNLEGFFRNLGRTRQQARLSGETVSQALVGSLTGTGGLIFGLTAASALAPQALGLIKRLFDDTAESAEDARDRIREVYDEILQINRTPVSLSFDGDSLDAAIQGTQKRVDDLRQTLRLDDGARARANQESFQQIAQQAEAAAASVEALTTEQRAATEADLARKEALLATLTDERDLIADIEQARRDAIEAGAEDTELIQQLEGEGLSPEQAEALRGMVAAMQEALRKTV